jgi:glycosyltransferase involved in cell wall biosynthesis
VSPADDRLRVQGLTAYPLSAASARVRVGNFRPFLEPAGIDLIHRPALNERDYAVLVSGSHPARKAAVLAKSAARAALSSRADGLVLVHRLVLLAPFPGIDPPARIDAYDFDDALTVGSPADGNRSFQWLKREPQRAASSMRKARVVIAANPFLAAQAREFNASVEVIPSCVDPSEQALHDHGERDVVTLGWIGSHTTVAYLDPVLPVISRINRSGPRVRLVVVGGDTGLREPWIEHRPWSLQSQSADLAEFDLGIMPLPDTDWARGKSGYKLLQYFAAGVPAVASPVGVNAELIADGRGLPATTAKDWEQALTAMIGDAEGRRASGAAAREFVEREYSYQRWAPELASLLRGLA